MNSQFNIDDRVIVVTGATGTLAGATAKYLQAEGARLAYIGRSEEKLAATMAAANRINGRFMGIVCDVTDQVGLDSAYAQVMERWGRVDGLINGAGGNMPGATIEPGQDIFELNMQDYSRVLDLNLKGTVMPTLTFARAFKQQGSGSVVNFSSMASSLVISRVLGYSNAKAAVDNFTRWMATEFARQYGDGIRVNAIAPGFFIAKQNRALLQNGDGSSTERGQAVLDQTPFGRFGRTEEIFGTIQYLLSDASSFVTGSVIPVDGGFSINSGV
ncbi:SDR family oxidoreductase [Coraliomargarita akajimensis]|uniref:Short-chain dehydrogenase/reductase SDR n=1 Tax=Coraliomargarita akajimensis (strain DSM 45221 / IAM 15411 / JCM 23193 / KCTC 12865 / 04OKA010-24) TaxID=583355 RepID=D5EN46_CORAD|nr:SDR family oxidoreductase [Coraliomargarita akajimensis]ADE53481.1 short-chain dehydrogenase/reductase SDR [Coraliomargarita akajimensis DSM 45221]